MKYSDIPGLPLGERSKIQFEITSPLSSPTFKESKCTQSSGVEPSNTDYKPSPNISRRLSGPLGKHGESIPNPEQYQKLILQAKTIYENLPTHIQSSL
jgi:hypothetical protein